MKKLFIAVLSALVATSAQAQSLEDRVAELEANQSLNIFKFSGSLETKYDNYVLDPDTTAAKTKMDYHRLRFHLNADAEVSKDISFYSRLVTTKVFNEYDYQGGTSSLLPNHLSIGRDYLGGPGVYLEKAYADVRLGGGFVLSFGRLPTVDGPLTHMPNGKARQGTYPGMIYNAILDGYALSYNTDMGDAGNLSARFIYTPLTYWNKGAGSTDPFVTAPTEGGNKANTLIDLNSFMIEWNKANMGWTKNLSVIAQTYMTGWNGYDGSKTTMTATQCAGIGAQITAAGGNGAAFTAACNANPTLIGANFFKITSTNLTVMTEGIAESDFDLGLSFVSSQTENEGYAYVTGVSSVPILKGIAVDNVNETAKGTGMLISAKYNFGTSYAGAEYVSNTKGNFVFPNAFEDMGKFYATNGNGYHAYFGHKLKPELTVRLGMYLQNLKHGDYTFGAQTEYTNSPKNTVTYANLRLDF